MNDCRLMTAVNTLPAVDAPAGDPPVARTLDCRGLICPLPVLRARKALMALAPGAVLEVWTSDPGALRDMPAFCQETGHRLLAMERVADTTLFRIARA